jgi:hypothetical protein
MRKKGCREKRPLPDSDLDLKRFYKKSRQPVNLAGVCSHEQVSCFRAKRKGSDVTNLSELAGVMAQLALFNVGCAKRQS